MNKSDFLTQLRERLWALSQEDAKASVDYYGEMIDDRMEEGLTEEEAVAAVGNLEEIAEEILQATPHAPGVKKAPKEPRSWKNWEILLLVLGAPLWVPLLVAAVSVIIAVLMSLWSVVISLYATAVALGASAVGCILAVVFMAGGTSGTVLVAVGAALLCAGLAILMFMVSNLSAKGMIALTKLAWKGIRRIFGGKEGTA